jgi:pilus assembly protein CpaE
MEARERTIRVAAIGRTAELERLSDALALRSEVDLLPARSVEHIRSRLDAVLLELPHGPDAAAVAAVRAVTAAPVVVLAPVAPPGLLEWAAEAEVSDVLVRPYDAGAAVFALTKAIRASRQPAPAGGRVVTVFSPKGGTGKSVVATSLAAALARHGQIRTLLVDLDLQFGDAAIMLGLTPPSTIRELVASPAALDAEALAVYADRHPCGLDVLAAPRRPEEAELVGDDFVRGVLGVARASYEAVVVDSAPFFHGTTVASLDLTDELVVVCTPDIPTAKNVRLALETIELLALPSARVRVALNRAGEAGGMRREDVEEALGRAVDVVLPFDTAVPVGVNRGVPAPLASGGGSFSEALAALAAELFPPAAPAAPVLPRPRRRLLPAFARS